MSAIPFAVFIWFCTGILGVCALCGEGELPRKIRWVGILEVIMLGPITLFIAVSAPAIPASWDTPVSKGGAPK